MPIADLIVHNIGQLVTVPADTPDHLGVLTDAALAAHDGKIVWIGSTGTWQRHIRPTPDVTIIDAQGRLVTPGFVDSHTHLVYAGQRAAEFHERLHGASYADQLQQGRGIHSTVNATRAAGDEELLNLARRRLRSCMIHGSTTVEIKTGYGLDRATEERSLTVIERLHGQGPRVVPTFMGAHVVPVEYRQDRQAYLRLLIDEMLPAFAGRAQFCDVFCEETAFDVEESRAVLQRAGDLGYKLKLHANQLAASGGAMLAAELGAVSADHLDFLSEDEIAALARAGVVATLLPGCSMTLRTAYPSAQPLIEAGVPVALATDYNPGTCACPNMQLMIALAVLYMDMTVEQALRAATLGGARALAMQHEVGSLEVGKYADLLLWDAETYLELGYRLGTNLVQSVIVGGRVVDETADERR